MRISVITKLRVRKIDEKLDLDNILEINHCYHFKLFHSTFDSNSYADSYFNYYNDEMKITYGFGATSHNFKLNLEEFIEPSKIMESKNRIYVDQEDMDPIEQNFLPIGICSMNQILLLGVGESNLDEIYLDTFFKEPRFQFIANDIFEFLRGIELEPKNYGDFKDFSQLYKNWGEDFWRVRED